MEDAVSFLVVNEVGKHSFPVAVFSSLEKAKTYIDQDWVERETLSVQILLFDPCGVVDYRNYQTQVSFPKKN